MAIGHRSGNRPSPFGTKTENVYPYRNPRATGRNQDDGFSVGISFQQESNHGVRSGMIPTKMTAPHSTEGTQRNETFHFELVGRRTEALVSHRGTTKEENLVRPENAAASGLPRSITTRTHSCYPNTEMLIPGRFYMFNAFQRV